MMMISHGTVVTFLGVVRQVHNHLCGRLLRHSVCALLSSRSLLETFTEYIGWNYIHIRFANVLVKLLSNNQALTGYSEQLCSVGYTVCIASIHVDIQS